MGDQKRDNYKTINSKCNPGENKGYYNLPN